jgi:hypothetical protein
MLPLEVSPKPRRTERVFVGRIELHQRFFDPILKSIGMRSQNVPAEVRTALACKSHGN